MRLTLSWLSDFVDLPSADGEQIATALEGLGHEVEEWHVMEPSFRGVVVGRVIDVEPHPDADKVRVCRVDVGAEMLDIVCGAWNFEAGALVPVALPGAVLQGEFEIERRAIRGVESNGMICSEAELDLGEDAAGIMVLDADYPEAAASIGEDFASVVGFPDVFFDVSITPNRPDAMSVYGLARELAALYDIELHSIDIRVTEVGPPGETSVTLTDETACPRFVGREVRNITVGQSPHWLRARLVAAGVRPINNVVDASNYAMMELGHPTHAFDLDRLGSTIVVRHAREGERITTLDDVTRDLEAGDIVVADAERPVAIAGIMGGADTEVHEQSTRVLVEAAYWHPPSILLTSKRLGLRSEASARFERGMDPGFCPTAADRVAELLGQIAGGEVAPGLADEYPEPYEPRTVRLPVAEVARVLGVVIPRERIVDLLRRLEFDVTGEDPLVVTVPTRRGDVARPVDLVEEIARLQGFDHIPDRVLTGGGGGLPLREQQLRKLRRALVGAGYHESLTFSFIGSSDLDALGLAPGDPARSAIRLVNPMRDEEGVMRTTLLPGLLKGAAINLSRRVEPVRLFEIGKVFIPGAGKLPEQPDRLGFTAAGGPAKRWDGPAGETDLYDATGLWDLIAAEMRLPDPELRTHAQAPFHPGRCAEILVAGTPIGVVGELHPAVARSFGLDGRVTAGELDVSPLLLDRGDWQYAAPSIYPPQIFDLAFAVPVSVSAGAVLEAIDGSAGEWLEKRTVFDVYRGGSIDDGQKSLAVSVTLRAPDRTLTDEEAAPVRRQIAAAVVDATGGELRGEV